VTERTAGRVTQVDPGTGAKTTILTIEEVLATEGEQDGLLGMAFHPDVLKGGDHPYVYLSYTYDGGEDTATAPDRRQRLVRYTFDDETNTLVEPMTLLQGLPASDDHNSGRLVLGPDRKLYYTIGDRGNNQDLNACRANEAQRLPTGQEVEEEDWDAYRGKTLRLNLDGSVPGDNPRLDGVRSHVLTYGHRNAQGLTFGEEGRLYSSEQGPKSDDEINLLEPGGNYGWPYAAGFKDDSGHVFGDWSAVEGCGTTVPYDAFEIPATVPQYAEHDFRAANVTAPLRTYYTVPSNHDFQGDACAPSGFWFICYPTIAPSPLELWRSVNRYRDTAYSDDGETVYVVTDSAGLARGTDGDATTELEDPGALIAFTYNDEDDDEE
jgi:PQQ-dependent dehydrogenase (s-GDH family)